MQNEFLLDWVDAPCCPLHNVVKFFMKLCQLKKKSIKTIVTLEKNHDITKGRTAGILVFCCSISHIIQFFYRIPSLHWLSKNMDDTLNQVQSTKILAV